MITPKEIEEIGKGRIRVIDDPEGNIRIGLQVEGQSPLRRRVILN